MLFSKNFFNPLGEIVDYAIRIEFQARGSPHAHCVIWVRDAPKFEVDDDTKVCDFIDQYISCEIPKEEGSYPAPSTAQALLILHDTKVCDRFNFSKSCKHDHTI